MLHTRLGALLLAFLPVIACKPDEIHRVFFCEASSLDPECGTTDDGRPMVCFAAKQLGAGKDFCAEPCGADDTNRSEASESICLKGAKLQTCRPSEANGCPEGLACLRTDLTQDRGVCLAMRVCAVDTDCPDSVVRHCGSTVLNKLFPKANYLTSNLQCVTTGCGPGLSSCAPGESCLPGKVLASSPVPDICVPNCDSQKKCPPNYTCWQQVSGTASPDVCIPTLPGARCLSSLDCWAGDCVDTGAGFNMCAVPCSRDEDCVPFSDSSRRQYCVLTKNDKRVCLSVSPFAGAICVLDETCPEGQKCFQTSPYWADHTLGGECRVPCPEGTRCPARGGMSHACLVRLGQRSCYPGVLGVTCERSEECLAGRKCVDVPGEAASEGTDYVATGPTRVCTQACTSDRDCIDNWNNQEGYCSGGWCRLTHNLYRPCTRHQHCSSGNCDGKMCRPGCQPEQQTCRPAR